MTANSATGSIALRRGLILAAALLFALEAFPAVWYVNKNAEPGGDGTSWATAFQTIEPAVNAAADDGGGEVWIAAGVYDEERAGFRGRLFVKETVEVYGGFVGDESLREQRDWHLYECIIDGSISWAGAAAEYVISCGSGTRVDGVTVTHGRSGVFMGANSFLANCIIRDNRILGGDLGAGISAQGAIIEDCVVRDNGGSGISATSTVVRRCQISNNAASAFAATDTACLVEDTSFTNHQSSAAYLSRWSSSPVRFLSCTFRDNVGYRGGAVFFDAESDWSSPPGAEIVFANCFFINNEAVLHPERPSTSGQGGAVFLLTAAYPEYRNLDDVKSSKSNYPLAPHWQPNFVNCTFTGNRAASGGALYWLDKAAFRNASGITDMVIANCIFWDNGPEPIAGKYAEIAPLYTGTFTHCIIEGGFPGTSILNLDPKFWDAANGDFRLMPDSPAIDRGRDTSTAAYGGVVDDFLGCPRGYDGDGLGAVTGDGSDYDIGAFEYMPECSGEGEGEGAGEGEGEGETGIHSADQDGDGRINLLELLRIVQFFNAGGFHCADAPAATEDGYLAGSGPAQSCRPHASDYNGGAPNWQIDLTELLRLIQFFSAGGYHHCPDAATEDGYCPGAQ